MSHSNASSESDAAPLDFELPVLPPEWRRIPKSSLEQLLQLSRWNEPEFRARRRREELREGSHCMEEFVLDQHSS